MWFDFSMLRLFIFLYKKDGNIPSTKQQHGPSKHFPVCQEIVYIYIYAMCLENWKKKRIDSLVFPPQKLVTAFTIHIYTFLLASADLANVKKYGNSRSLFFTLDGSNSLTFFHFGRWLRDVNYSECWSNRSSYIAI